MTYDLRAMYANVLLIHNWLRWFTLLMCVGAIVYAARPPKPGSTELPGKTWDVYLMLAVDLQMLTGLILYFVCALGAHIRAHDAHIGGAAAFLVLASSALLASLGYHQHW